MVRTQPWSRGSRTSWIRARLPTGCWDDAFVNDFGEREDLHGFEWDFLALDRHGSIAVLTTAGEGAIPPAVVRERALVELAVGALGKLAARGESIDLRTQDRLSGNYSDWFELSRRGLFTYDWNLLHDGPYERVSAPTMPMRVGEVDPAIAKAAALHRVLSSFSEAGQIQISEPGR